MNKNIEVDVEKFRMKLDKKYIKEIYYTLLEVNPKEIKLRIVLK